MLIITQLFTFNLSMFYFSIYLYNSTCQ